MGADCRGQMLCLKIASAGDLLFPLKGRGARLRLPVCAYLKDTVGSERAIRSKHLRSFLRK